MSPSALHLSPGREREFDYVQMTTDLTINGSSGAPNTVVTGNSVYYDGATTVYIEVYTASLVPGSAALIVEVYEDGVSIGRVFQTGAATGQHPAFGAIRRTPAAGSHVYTVKAWKNGGTDGVFSGLAGTYPPGFMRVRAATAVVTGESGGGSGWASAGETWTYASADSPTFTFTVSGDVSAKYSPGMRVKLTQTTVKYFIVTKVDHSAGTTTITVYGGTDYTLANAAITSPYFSTHKAPAGFPLDPSKWTVSLVDTSNRSQASPSAGTWYNLGSLSLIIPIGVWNVDYQVVIENVGSSSASRAQQATLSTANNSESDTEFSCQVYGNAITNNGGLAYRSKTVSLTVKTTYYLNSKANAGSSSIAFQGGSYATTIRAVCAYL